MAPLHELHLWKLCHMILLAYMVSGQSTEDLLDCSARPVQGTSFRMGSFIFLECGWRNESGNDTQELELAWFRREISGNLSEISASHMETVKWRLALDDNGIDFVCVPTNGSQVLESPSCVRRPLAIPPSVSIVSTPGTHVIGENNLFTCNADGDPEIADYEWYVNKSRILPSDHENFDTDHYVVGSKNHKYLTVGSLNVTDNGTEITCLARTTTGIANNKSLVLVVVVEGKKSTSFLSESVVLIACLCAGGAPVLFLICVCAIWGVQRSCRKRRRGYDIDYSGSFKSDTDNNPAATPEGNTSLSRPLHNNHTHSPGSSGQHGHGTVAAAIQRPNFFRQKLVRLSQMIFAPVRYVDDESIYENTTPSSQHTTLNDLSRGGSLQKHHDVSRGGSLQMSHRPSLNNTPSTVSTPLSAPPVLQNDEQDYENFVPPHRAYENTPSILDSPTSPTW